MTTRRTLVIAMLSVAVGLAIAFVDTRPGWDDTGITAGALFGAALVLSLVAGRRPWLWGFLVGIWLPVLELPSHGDPAALAALAFAFAGAFAGWAVSKPWRADGESAAGE